MSRVFSALGGFVMKRKKWIAICRSSGPGRGGPGRRQGGGTGDPEAEESPFRLGNGPGGGAAGERARGGRRGPGDQGGRRVRRFGPRPVAPGARGRRGEGRRGAGRRWSQTSTRRSRSPTSRRAGSRFDLELQDAERELAMQQALFDAGYCRQATRDRDSRDLARPWPSRATCGGDGRATRSSRTTASRSPGAPRAARRRGSPAPMSRHRHQEGCRARRDGDLRGLLLQRRHRDLHRRRLEVAGSSA